MGTGTEAFWEPHQHERPLNNFGILVTGDPGAGKTQLLRAFIHEMAKLGLPLCIFDFKNDYAEKGFSEQVGLKVYDIDHDGLPFNPLSLVGDENGEAQPIRQVHELAAILRRVFDLGDQQESRLRNAMSKVFADLGLDPKARHRITEVAGEPSFGLVRAILEHDVKNEPLLNRLSPLFDLNLFPEPGAVKSSFEALLGDRVVLDLHRLPNDRIKAAIAEFIIVRLHVHVLRGDQPRRLRRLLVLDEAWRVKDSERLQELAREGRAFGVAIAIGTQFPGDIPETLAGNLATQVFLQNKEHEHQKAVARNLCGAASGPKATQLIGKIALLQKHEGFLRNQQYAPYVFVRTTPHFKRGESQRDSGGDAR